MRKASERMCIVSRERVQPDELIRFVLGPGDQLFVDLKGKLPGRGCWVSTKKSLIEKASAKNLFSSALKAKVNLPDDLPQLVDEMLVKSALGMVHMARKAGQFITGSAKVDKAVRSGEALAVFHATDAAADGVRKIDQARTFFSKMTEENKIPSFSLFSSDQMADSLGDGNYIHAAALAGKAGQGVLNRAAALARYREL